ncbi:MAG: hypothetical protein LQ352_007544 [Teloschistes flavicans]|nr:MAG: hypothetical protein LQ352_007544 [Teloschistes flavicans]
MDKDPILDGLNNEQLAAVTSPANVLQILAPPGSGKTKTLTARVAYLIKHHHYRPWDILCLTFTIKSSREMKERLSKLIGNGMEAKLVLGTFHSVCRRYLVSYGHLIGIPKNFGIADSGDSSSIIKRIVKRLGLNIDPKVAQSRISSTKSKGLSYPEPPKEAAKKKDIDRQEFLQAFEAYEDYLDQANLLDYDDLLLRCSDLLRQHPECVSNIEAVLIDEFQDTNLVQFDLMRLFAVKQKRITTVGDPDQSIYGWRSAEVENLHRMKTQYPDTLVIDLQANYRSSGAILLAAQELIEQDQSRPSKSLRPTHCPGTIPVLRRLPSSDTEALWIVSEIKRAIGMTGSMLSHQDFAILLRSAALSRHIESAMGRAGIPYRMVGGQKFFDRVEVKILLDYLRAVSQPSNNDAIVRVLNVPARSVGPATVAALMLEADSKKVTLWALIRDIVQGNIKSSTKITKPAEQGLGAFIRIVLTGKQRIGNPSDPATPQNLLQYIIKTINFQEYLKKSHEDHESRWANVEELISQAADYQAPQIPPSNDGEIDNDTDLPVIEGIAQSKGDVGEEMLSMFLANVALATELQKDDEDPEGQGQSRSLVTISTIHAAKGLEWPVVFVPAAYEGSIPHSRAEDTDEERRLLYVAMTRAQALLYISCPVKDSRKEDTVLSQFLDPKNVGQYVVNAGPRLDSGIVSDIARILRRSCPSWGKIMEECVQIQNCEDNLWPLDGSKHADDEKSKRELGGLAAASDRQTNTTNARGSTISVGYTTTMDATQAFKMSSMGFTSATSQFHRLEKERSMTVGRESRTAAKDEVTAPSRKRKALDQTQSSLPSLWGSKVQRFDQDRPASGSTSKRSAPSEYMKPRSGPHGAGDLSRRPLASIPENLSKHGREPCSRPPQLSRRAIEEGGTSEQYIILSSSPFDVGTIDEKKTQAVEAKRSKYIEFTATNQTYAQGEWRANDIRPAHTTHITSMAQIQEATASRRTLGVRRTMHGWNAKGANEFSVPTKVKR